MPIAPTAASTTPAESARGRMKVVAGGITTRVRLRTASRPASCTAASYACAAIAATSASSAPASAARTTQCPSSFDGGPPVRSRSLLV